MNQYYIINKTVLFYPEEHRLVTIGKLDSDIWLNIPASRCLALLIERNGELITQKEFFAEVWESQGTYVTQNTFYQNISLLRKGLKAAGLGEDPIKTVLKRGMTLGDSISIETGEVEGVNSDATSPAPHAAQSEVAVLIPADSGKSRTSLRWLKWYYLSFITLFIIFTGLYSSERFSKNDYFAHYKLYSSENGCKIMIPEQGKITDIYSAFISENIKTCPPNSIYYLSIVRDDPRTTVFICNKDIHIPGADCTSYFYLEHRNG